MGKLRQIGEELEQLNNADSSYESPIIFKKNNKYYTSASYNKEMPKNEIGDCIVISFDR